LRAETVLSLKVRDFPADSPMLSDIQLSTKIASKFEERSHPFFKNTLRVVPNPVRLYTPAMPFLYYYCEAYNLGRAAPDTVIRLECRVFDANGKPVTEVEPFQRIVSTRNESSVQWGAVRVGSLPGGKYDLNLKLVRPSGQPADGQSVTFFVYGSAPDSTGTQALSADQMLLNSEFAGMTESEIDGEFNRAIYLFHKDEQREFKNMKSVDAKRAWLFRFWKRLDTNPGTIDNEFRLEYFRRIGLANERYQSFQHEGWQTDRGRVFLMYGEPSSVMLYPNESDMRPYEVWYYDNLQGGVEFVFVDFNMTREYRLVHSTLRGEIRNNDWKDMARKGAY
jgi:GWxTD domain-containing protein